MIALPSFRTVNAGVLDEGVDCDEALGSSTGVASLLNGDLAAGAEARSGHGSAID